MSSSKNLEFEKTAFLSKSNSAFIEEMYVKFINSDPNLPDSWKEYFKEIGDEADIVLKEINGPSWSPSPKKALIKNGQKDYKENKLKQDGNLEKKNKLNFYLINDNYYL